MSVPSVDWPTVPATCVAGTDISVQLRLRLSRRILRIRQCGSSCRSPLSASRRLRLRRRILRIRRIRVTTVLPSWRMPIPATSNRRRWR